MQPLEVRGVGKRYPRGGFELHAMDFSVAAGEVFAVLGLNGAGKSTLLRMIAGTVSPDRGEVLVGGRRVGRGPTPRLSVVLDGGRSLYWKMTVAENIDYFAALKGAPWRGRGERRRAALAASGLDAKADALVGTLSRGMQQRLVLAIALGNAPAVLLLDEPTLGVDFVHEAMIADAVRALRAQGCAIVLTSHQLDFVEALANRALFLEGGRAVEQRSLPELREAMSQQVIELTLACDPDAGTLSRLHALGAQVTARQVRAAAHAGDVYQLLDALRPIPIESCELGRADLRGVMEHYVREKAA
jgi:ABC-2 type transport system ATP-binding protein